MGFLQTAEVALGALVVLALLGILFLWVRRQVIAGAQPLLMCALRANAAQPWRLGLLRLGPTTLEWFSVAGPSTKPGRSWPRADLLFGTSSDFDASPVCYFSRFRSAPVPDRAMVPMLSITC